MKKFLLVLTAVSFASCTTFQSPREARENERVSGVIARVSAFATLPFLLHIEDGEPVAIATSVITAMMVYTNVSAVKYQLEIQQDSLATLYWEKN